MKTFLVVDDEPMIRFDLAEMIAAEGIRVLEAGNVGEALAILERDGDDISALITDVQMPGSRSGLVLANHVRFAWPHIRIVVVSGARPPVAGELPGDAHFLRKPLGAAALWGVLGRDETGMSVLNKM